MNRKINTPAFLAWLWTALLFIATVFVVINELASRDPTENVISVIGTILDSLSLFAFPVVGALIISRQPKNSVGWLLMVTSLTSILDPFIRSQIIGLTAPPQDPSFFFLAAVLLSNTTWLLAIIPIFFIALLFPTGKPLTPRWRWAVAYALAVSLSFFGLAILDKTLAPDASIYGVNWSIRNPLGILEVSDSLLGIWLAGLVILALLSVASIVLRYRRANGSERKQINWILYAISVFGAFYIPYTLSQSWGAGIWAIFIDIFFITIPLSIGIAILRYRLYDIDIIIRRTLQYSLLTGLLALVYFGSVVLLQSLTENMIGEQSPLVIVLSTLMIAALFNPLRTRVQTFIDRRFFRQKYDAALTLANFAAVARDEVAMERLSAALLGVIDETMQPQAVSFWLRENTGRRGQP